MSDEEAADQFHAAADAIGDAVALLLREDEIHPQLIVMAVARVTGELAASAALAGGEDVEVVAGELAEVVREVARDHGEMLRTVKMSVAGNP